MSLNVYYNSTAILRLLKDMGADALTSRNGISRDHGQAASAWASINDRLEACGGLCLGSLLADRRSSLVLQRDLLAFFGTLAKH